MQEWIVKIRTWMNEHKKITVLAVFLFIFGIILIVLVKLSFPNSSQTGKPHQTSITQILPSSVPNISPAKSQTQAPPNVFFNSYQNSAVFPTVPDTVNAYIFKTNYTLEDVVRFGQELGLTEHKTPNDKFVILYNQTDPDNRGILLFNRETGAFTFQSYATQRLTGKDTTFKTAYVQSYLSNLSLTSDSLLSCPITYQKQGFQDVTFVECHRDWSKIGLPVYNVLGVINLPEEESLGALVLGGVDNKTPNDPSIINASTHQDGKARPNDFNTVTVGILPDGRIVSIDSNLRSIAKRDSYPKSDLFSPEEALKQFTNHQSQFSLTIPAGKGVVDLTKVYQNNQAQAKKATITDYVLVYLEKPAEIKQDILVPMYEIRGTAEISSGYTVRFTETVPALKSKLSFLETKQKAVAGDSTSLIAQQPGLQLHTFQPTNFIPPSGSSDQTPTPTPPAGGCVPAVNQLNPVYELNNNLGKIGYWVGGDPGGGTRMEYYFIRPQNPPMPDLDAILRELDRIIQNTHQLFPIDFRARAGMELDWNNVTSTCPIRFTGGSPILYLYPTNTTQIKVKLNSPILYTYPSAQENEWNVTAHSDGMLSPTNARLYYEYDKSKVTFTEPIDGFVVKKNGWEGFIKNTLAKKLGLTARETDDLIIDVKNALVDMQDTNYSYLKISFANVKEINDKLPLTISPKPDTFIRIHLLLTAEQSNNIITPPTVTQLKRNGLTAIEIGVKLTGNNKSNN